MSRITSLSKSHFLVALAALTLWFTNDAAAGYVCSSTTSTATYCSFTTSCSTGYKQTYKYCNTSTYGAISGSSAVQYTCTNCSGYNSVYPGSPGAGEDSATTAATCQCTGDAKGSCDLNLQWSGNLVQCNDSSGDAVISWTANCSGAGKDWNVSGTLTCPNQSPTFTDLLGFPDTNPAQGCRTALGSKTAEALHFSITVANTSCADALATTDIDINNFTVNSVSETTNKTCHSQGGTTIDCGTTNNTHSAKGTAPNLIHTTCTTNPNTVNTNCTTGKGSNDSGGINVCLINLSGTPDYSSFDPTNLDGTTATMNGYPAKSWTVTDCNGDGMLDFQGRFPTCVAKTTTVPYNGGTGPIHMETYFNSQKGGVEGDCTVTTN